MPCLSGQHVGAPWSSFYCIALGVCAMIIEITVGRGGSSFFKCTASGCSSGIIIALMHSSVIMLKPYVQWSPKHDASCRFGRPAFPRHLTAKAHMMIISWNAQITMSVCSPGEPPKFAWMAKHRAPALARSPHKHGAQHTAHRGHYDSGPRCSPRKWRSRRFSLFCGACTRSAHFSGKKYTEIREWHAMVNALHQKQGDGTRRIARAHRQAPASPCYNLRCSAVFYSGVFKKWMRSSINAVAHVAPPAASVWSFRIR
jgi:hypothetical protein